MIFVKGNVDSIDKIGCKGESCLKSKRNLMFISFCDEGLKQYTRVLFLIIRIKRFREWN